MKYRKVIALSGLFLTMSVGAVSADDYRDVVRDSEGQVVHSEFSGTCVRTKWISDQDACGCPPAETTVEHTIIAKEDRTVYFAFDKADLTQEDTARLDSLAERLNSATDVQGARVVGYADRIGTASYNEKLSKKRAQVVRDYLIAHGVVNADVTKVRWVGKSEPTAQCSVKMPHGQLVDCLQPDRRVEVEVVYHSETTTTAPEAHHAHHPHHKPAAKPAE